MYKCKILTVSKMKSVNAKLVTIKPSPESKCKY